MSQHWSRFTSYWLASIFMRPFHVKDKDKPMVIEEMVNLGVLKEDMSPYSSPIMLIPRKNSSLKRHIADFRFLNSRLPTVKLVF